MKKVCWSKYYLFLQGSQFSKWSSSSSIIHSCFSSYKNISQLRILFYYCWCFHCLWMRKHLGFHVPLLLFARDRRKIITTNWRKLSKEKVSMELTHIFCYTKHCCILLIYFLVIFLYMNMYKIITIKYIL